MRNRDLMPWVVLLLSAMGCTAEKIAIEKRALTHDFIVPSAPVGTLSGSFGVSEGVWAMQRGLAEACLWLRRGLSPDIGRIFCP